jgi:hypothetical protein
MTPLNRCSLQRFGACWIKPQIRIKGQLGAQWGAWFDGMTITQTANGETLITGLVADQAALYGLLRKVRDLGLPLLSVSCREPGSVDRPCDRSV